jgi:hypothetical protein
LRSLYNPFFKNFCVFIFVIFLVLLPSIVFKLGPVQGPGSGFWPGHRVGRIIPYLKKIQNGVVLVKKKQKKTKINGLQPSFWPGVSGSAGSHRIMTFHIFSSTRPGFSHGSAGSQVDPSGRAGFQNYASIYIKKLHQNKECYH